MAMYLTQGSFPNFYVNWNLCFEFMKNLKYFESHHFWTPSRHYWQWESASSGSASSRRSLHPRGNVQMGVGGGQTPPPHTWDTTGYRQQAGGTHPTGMHSCSVINLNLNLWHLKFEFLNYKLYFHSIIKLLVITYLWYPSGCGIASDEMQIVSFRQSIPTQDFKIS